DRVEPTAQSELARERVGVDDEEPDLLLQHRVLDLARQVLPDRVWSVGRVQEDGRSGHGDVEHVPALEEPELVAADEIGAPYEIGRPDRGWSEAQVRHGDRPRLLRVIHEVALAEAVG